MCSYKDEANFGNIILDRIPLKMSDTGKVPMLLSKRWLLAYMCFYGYFCQYLHRTNLSLAIVCMVKTALPNDTETLATPGTSLSNTTLLSNVTVVLLGNTSSVLNGTDGFRYQASTSKSPFQTVVDDPCGIPLEERQSENERAEFVWGKPLVSGILSSYFYGVIVTQVLGGWLSIRFGGKKIIAAAMFMQAVCSILIPELTRVNYVFLIVLRVITGLVAGTVSPAYFTIWTKWAPPDERGRLLNISLLGGIVGTVVSFSTSGLMCAYGFDRGWGSIFYTHGFLTLLYICIWMLFASETPSDHPSITEEEANYITEATAGSVAANKRDASIPWKSIITSPAVLVLIFTHTCYNWSNYVVLTTLPLYMKEVLRFDIKQNGVLTSLPQICCAFTMVLVGFLSDIVTKRGCLSITAARRVFQGISFMGLSVCLFVITFCDCTLSAVAVAVMCLGLGFVGLCQGGYYLNAVDFAPRYSGVIYGLSNSISSTTGTYAPIIVGLLTVNGTRSEWNNVFYVCIGVSIAGTLVFSTLSRGEIQPWAGNSDGTVMELTIAAPGEENTRLSNKQLKNLMISTEMVGSLHSLHSIN